MRICLNVEASVPTNPGKNTHLNGEMKNKTRFDHIGLEALPDHAILMSGFVIKSSNGIDNWLAAKNAIDDWM